MRPKSLRILPLLTEADNLLLTGQKNDDRRFDVHLRWSAVSQQAQAAHYHLRVERLFGAYSLSAEQGRAVDKPLKCVGASSNSRWQERKL